MSDLGTISAVIVKDLRSKTGAGMMDCKKALVETAGDFEAAVDWLRTKGLASAAKKAGRVAAEGLTALKVDGFRAAVVEINAETDFVSKNKTFQDLAKVIANQALSCANIEELKNAQLSDSQTVEEAINANVAVIGECLTLRRMQQLKINNGVIASYVHNAAGENMGKIAVLVALESDGDKTRLQEVGKQIAMHIAATKPECLTQDQVDPALIEREKNIFTEQSRASGKADNIIQKMIEGRIRKFLEEIVLVDQIFVIDGESKISQVIQNLAKELNTPVTISNYARFELGEGIEKETKNFADEVAAVVKN